MLRIVTAVFLIALSSTVHASSRLDQVLKTGVVRVGTTGDYHPFTAIDSRENSYRGIDVDMARHLGDALGVKVVFVRTTWKSLMTDFLAQKFDMAMGGISINLERQKQAFFSIPYLVTGKAAIGRCQETSKYRSLSDIDQKGVRLIVNPGGTNEAFVKQRIKSAKVIVFPDNRTIFKEIVAGRADVMITDAVEAQVQAAAHTELCSIRSDKPFTYAEFGYLLPRGDVVFKAWVDQWLHIALKSGEFERIYRQGIKGSA